MGTIYSNPISDGLNEETETDQIDKIQNVSPSIIFSINGLVYNINPLNSDGLTVNSKLVDFIRDWAHIKGTKSVCREGGCGACIVNFVSRNDPIVKGINSCLVTIWSIDGWSIWTIESLGSSRTGFHEIQKKFAQHGATQCGYCTSGMIMNMHGFVQNRAKKGQKISPKDVEDAMDGNICRCTGYRPIVEACKDFAKFQENLQKTCKKTECEESACCENTASFENLENFENFENDYTLNEIVGQSRNIHLTFPSGVEWLRPLNLSQYFEIMSKISTKSYKLVSSNTSVGILRDDLNFYEIYIDISCIVELRQIELQENIFSLGCLVTFEEMLESLKKSAKMRNFGYSEEFLKNLTRISGTSVRNRATIGGNLMIKFYKRSFPSDLYILLEAIGARVLIYTSAQLTIDLSPSDFLNQQPTLMHGKILGKILLPPVQSGDFVSYFKTFKISSRFQNDGALIHGAFFAKFRNATIIESPSVIFGGAKINENFSHCRNLETFLIGKNLRERGTLNEALSILEGEILTENLVAKQMVLNAFYKMILGLYKNSIERKLKSGGDDLVRGHMSSVQKFTPGDKKYWPFGQPVSKIESMSQVSGELEYITDIPSTKKELFGAFVTSSIGKGEISSIDASDALKTTGVVHFITSKDIPGLNDCSVDLLAKAFFQVFTVDEILSSGKIEFFGQAIGLVLGLNREAAFEGARKVKIGYKNVQKPILDFNETLIMEKNDKVEQSNQISGGYRIGSQHHFSMETHVCLAIPQDNEGLQVHSATQGLQITQRIISKCLKIPAHNISGDIRKSGGAFGKGVTKSAQIAAVASIATWKTRTPVRIHLDLETSLQMMGKRAPNMVHYEVEFDPKTSKVTKNSCKFFLDNGWTSNESMFNLMAYFIQNCYKAHNWSFEITNVNTNTPNNTFCRAPQYGPFSLIEHIMEHISKITKMDPIEVRLANMVEIGDALFPYQDGYKFEDHNPLPQMIAQLMKDGDYHKIKSDIERFNLENRWKKRGIGFTCRRFPIYLKVYFDYLTIISVYHQDGSVQLAQTAAEMGQGINTKCAQIVASQFGIPLEHVKVAPMNNLVGPNNTFTGASMSSNLSTYTTIMACRTLLKKIEPVRKHFEGKKYTWVDLIGKCWEEGVELSATYKITPADKLGIYSTYGCALCEIELDVLTGETVIKRFDVIEDLGVSINPKIDIGQIEGAVMMGIGHLLTEKVHYDPVTGESLSKSTFDYKPPMAGDIPQDFRVTLWPHGDKKRVKGTLGARGVGEGPYCLATSVLFAIRQAIESARKDSGENIPNFFRMDAPTTPEDIVRLCLTSREHLVI